MAELIADCPRCGTAKTTFEVRADNQWAQGRWETFGVCRHCGGSTVFLLQPHDQLTQFALSRTGPPATMGRVLNDLVHIDGVVTIVDMRAEAAPLHIFDSILLVFNEGARCLAVNCFNAAGTMFRMYVDLATRDLDRSAATRRTTVLGRLRTIEILLD